ncbi:hypothetical protein LDENG_00130980 [Lucifuga dentata]|nr:hypothetical protein LDENG_00130980 [Lucifuga dentata]
MLYFFFPKYFYCDLKPMASTNKYKVFGLKGPYRPFCMFEPNIFNFHTRNVTDNHFLKHTTGTVN